MTQASGLNPFEFLKALWGPMGLPTGGLAVPTLDAAELERRVSELRAVESWLTMNLSLLRMSIQAMEVQLAALAALKQTQAMTSSAGANPILDAWMKALQSQAGAPGPDTGKAG
ncbi:MAG: hypothetical protein IT514_03615 [Burkholderiales bacterium]|nr:hypothetical protein [Burkholderiales bacterium]